MSKTNWQKAIQEIPIIIRSGLVFAIALTFSYCANEKAPEGGKKDTTPPKPKKIIPANKTLHFNYDKIMITFNEYIKPTGFAQTLISPPLDKKPIFTISNKTLIIKFKSHLRDSTTYTINFAEDIKDVNEGNILNNFTYVFSTGDFIDSQKISGKVIMAKDNTPADGVIVSLYPEDSINAIKRSKPFYFAKTDKLGNFKISNIKAAKYRVFGLKDQNYNYIYDQPNEMIAFSDTAINLTDTFQKKIDLYLFEEKTGKFTFDVKAASPGLIQISLNKPFSTLKIATDTAFDKTFWYANNSKDTINYWYSNYYKKRNRFFITVNDTVKDTARIELQYFAKDSLFISPKYSLAPANQSTAIKTSASSKENYNAQELYSAVKINFPRPLMEINENKPLKILADSGRKEIPITPAVDEKTKLFVSFDFDKQETRVYVLEVPDSVFKDIFGLWNKKFTYKFKTNSKDNYGNFNITLKTEHTDKNYIINLIDASGAIVKQFHFGGEKEKKISIPNMPAGTYKFTAIDDANNNGEWDTGNFMKKIQPEKIITFKDSYTLKGGWDLDVEIKL